MAGGDVHPGRFTADRHAVHRMIGRLHWRRRFGVYPMALHRGGTALAMRLSMMRLAVGDTLLLDGTPDDIARQADEERLIMLSPVAARAFRRSRAPIAIATMAAVVVLAALSVAPILTLALVGVAIVFHVPSSSQSCSARARASRRQSGTRHTRSSIVPAAIGSSTS